MKTNLLLPCVLVAVLTGCGTGCHTACIAGFGPGNSAFNAVADHYDSRDPCQTREFSALTGDRLKPAGYSAADRPDWCGAGRARRTIRDAYGRVIGSFQ